MDFKTLQEEFPIKKRMVYLNNASIGPLSTRVIAAVDEFLNDVRDNGRLHYPKWCRIADHEVKAKIGRFIGADKSEIAFVKNTTEGILLVANGLDWREGDNVIIADIEYPSNVYCWMNLARRGVAVKWIKNKAGRIQAEDIAALIDRRTRLVSLSGVQFSNGFRLDLERTGEICRKHSVLLNLDMIQYLGALDLNLADCPIDYLSAGGHKWLLAPIGTGIFYCRRSALEFLHPHNVGYHSVDKPEDHMDYDLTFRPNAGRFEEALVNFPGIWGLNAALDIFSELGMKNVEKHIFGLVDLAVAGLEAKGYQILSPQDPRERSGILSFRHPRISLEDIQERLEQARVHLAIRGSGLRISPSVYNDGEDIGALLAALP